MKNGYLKRANLGQCFAGKEGALSNSRSTDIPDASSTSNYSEVLLLTF